MAQLLSSLFAFVLAVALIAVAQTAPAPALSRETRNTQNVQQMSANWLTQQQRNLSSILNTILNRTGLAQESIRDHLNVSTFGGSSRSGQALQTAVSITCQLYHTYTTLEKYNQSIGSNSSVIRSIMRRNVEDSCMWLKQKATVTQKTSGITCDFDGNKDRTVSDLKNLCDHWKTLELRPKVVAVIQAIGKIRIS